MHGFFLLPTNNQKNSEKENASNLIW